MTPARRSGVTLRLLLQGLVLTAALPLLALAAWFFFAQLRHLRNEARQTVHQAADTVAEELEGAWSEAVRLNEALRPLITRRGDFCDPIHDLGGAAATRLELIILDSEGVTLCRGGGPLATLAIAGAAARREPSLILSGTALFLVVPFDLRKEERTYQLVVARELPLTSETNQPGERLLTVVDRKLDVLFRTEGAAKWVGRNVYGTDLASIPERTADAVTTGLDGVRRQYAYAEVGSLGWRVYAGIPLSVIQQPFRAQLWRGIIATVVLLLALFAVTSLLARRIARPIDELAMRARAAADPEVDVDFDATVGGPAEVVELNEAFVALIAKRRAYEESLSKSEHELRALSDRLLEIQESERSRIAREIHDDLGQTITAMKMDLGGLLQMIRANPDGAEKLGRRMMSQLDGLVGAVQRIAAELRPALLDDLGLVPALENEARLFEERTGIETELSIRPSIVDLDAATDLTVYRIVQEALTNVARHANATRVEIRVRRTANELTVEVRDDGSGMAAGGERESLGLLGIRERAAMAGGEARIEGFAGRGTIVSVRIPMEGGRT